MDPTDERHIPLRERLRWSIIGPVAAVVFICVYLSVGGDSDESTLDKNTLYFSISENASCHAVRCLYDHNSRVMSRNGGTSDDDLALKKFSLDHERCFSSTADPMSVEQYSRCNRALWPYFGAKIWEENEEIQFSEHARMLEAQAMAGDARAAFLLSEAAPDQGELKQYYAKLAMRLQQTSGANAEADIFVQLQEKLASNAAYLSTATLSTLDELVDAFQPLGLREQLSNAIIGDDVDRFALIIRAASTDDYWGLAGPAKQKFTGAAQNGALEDAVANLAAVPSATNGLNIGQEIVIARAHRIMDYASHRSDLRNSLQDRIPYGGSSVAPLAYAALTDDLESVSFFLRERISYLESCNDLLAAGLTAGSGSATTLSFCREIIGLLRAVLFDLGYDIDATLESGAATMDEKTEVAVRVAAESGEANSDAANKVLLEVAPPLLASRSDGPFASIVTNYQDSSLSISVGHALKWNARIAAFRACAKKAPKDKCKPWMEFAGCGAVYSQTESSGKGRYRFWRDGEVPASPPGGSIKLVRSICANGDARQ